MRLHAHLVQSDDEAQEADSGLAALLPDVETDLARGIVHAYTQVCLSTHPLPGDSASHIGQG